jgi:hypothetical protein
MGAAQRRNRNHMAAAMASPQQPHAKVSLLQLSPQ